MEPPGEAEKANIRQNLLLGQIASTSPSDFPAYFALYKSIFCSSNHSTAIQVDEPVFTSHADVLQCVERLRQNPSLTRQQLADTLSPNGSASQKEKDVALESMVRVVFMLDCSQTYARSFRVGYYSPTAWNSNDPFFAYVQRALPMHTGSFDVHRHKKALKAWKLKKRHNLQFRPTDIIAEHLLYDPSTRTVQVFHHTAYLQAHYSRCASQPITQQAPDSLKGGTLPPQLLLETLHSIHYILFPMSNDPRGRSRALLSSLMRKQNFDPDVEWVESYTRADVPSDFAYQYWNDRLEILYRIVKDRPPRNRFVSWIERHTSERNALTVAILGLFLSALFGFLACLIGIAQLVVSILAWKRPKEPA
ncbi:hypothetical protein BDW74DRAFT_168263 [Aspergillus multicolor]|uniref:uncharacterized protein n=1 Tax=Aspergillus multicolor TaxID=41759 RepID=UPI003CCE2107